MAKDLVLLKYKDKQGRQLAALCRPQEGMELLHSIVGSHPDAANWTVQSSKSAVAIATEGTVMVTSAEDLTLLSWWFAVAAEWLRTHGG